jgi:hypothetical protein
METSEAIATIRIRILTYRSDMEIETIKKALEALISYL